MLPGTVRVLVSVPSNFVYRKKNLKNWSDAAIRLAFGIQHTLGTSMDLCPSQRFGPPLAMDEFLSHNGSKTQQCQ